MKYEKINFTKYTIEVDAGMSLGGVGDFHPGVKVWYDTKADAENVAAELRAQRDIYHPWRYHVKKCSFVLIKGGSEDGSIYGRFGKIHGMTMESFEV